MCIDEAFYHRTVLSQDWLVLLLLYFGRSRKGALLALEFSLL